MGQVVAATVPIFLVVAVGFVLTRRGLFAAAEMGVLNRFVVKLALPLLIFLNVSGRSFAEILQPAYLLTYALASLAMFGVGAAWARAAGHGGVRAAFLGLAMGGTNNGMVGMALFLIALPEHAGLAVGMDMLVDNILIIPLALLLAERAGASGEASARRTLANALRNVATHPMVLAIAAALALNALGWVIPAMLASGVKLVAQAASGVALFAIGGMLTRLDVRSLGAEVVGTVAGKLLVMPAVALGVLLGLESLGLPPLAPQLKAAAVLTAALPTFSVVPALADGYGESDWTTASTLGGTALSFVTITGWMALVASWGWL